MLFLLYYGSESPDPDFRTIDAINSAFAALSIIALIISLLGAIGMAAFATSRRRHEIGVRKTLGSTVSEVVLLLLKDFSKPVIIGSLLAWPLAYYGASIYLDNFISKIDLGVWPWVASFLLINLIAILSVGGQSYAAARVPPSQVLRCE